LRATCWHSTPNRHWVSDIDACGLFFVSARASHFVTRSSILLDRHGKRSGLLYNRASFSFAILVGRYASFTGFLKAKQGSTTGGVRIVRFKIVEGKPDIQTSFSSRQRFAPEIDDSV